MANSRKRQRLVPGHAQPSAGTRPGRTPRAAARRAGCGSGCAARTATRSGTGRTRAPRRRRPRGAAARSAAGMVILPRTARARVSRPSARSASRSKRSCSKTRWVMITMALRRARRPVDQIPEPQVGFPVEALVRLVKQEHAGVVHQGQCEVQLLPGPTGQRAGRIPPQPGVPELADEFLSPVQRREAGRRRRSSADAGPR